MFTVWESVKSRTVESRNKTKRLSDYVVDLFHYPISWEYNVCKSKTRDTTSTSEFEEEKKNTIRIQSSKKKKKKRPMHCNIL